MSKDLIVLLIITLLTVIAWAGFDFYHASTQPVLPKVLQQQVKPLNPTLDFSGLPERSGQ